MTLAFVLSGGGSLGAVQVGMLQALSEHGVEPDLLVGTSAGALNAAYLAGRSTGRESLAGLEASWASVRRHDIFPVRPGHLLRSLGGLTGPLCADTGLRRVIAGHLTFELLEQAPIPLSVVATDLLSGEEVVISTGDAVQAVLASSAIPGLLPAVTREGRTLVDGGLANNTAVSQAVAAGADRVVVLPAGFACALAEPPRGALAAAMQAVSLLTQQRLVADVAAHAAHVVPGVTVAVVPTPCPLSVSPVDFGQAGLLVRLGREGAAAWLRAGGLDGAYDGPLVSLHHHLT